MPFIFFLAQSVARVLEERQEARDILRISEQPRYSIERGSMKGKKYDTWVCALRLLLTLVVTQSERSFTQSWKISKHCLFSQHQCVINDTALRLAKNSTSNLRYCKLLVLRIIAWTSATSKNNFVFSFSLKMTLLKFKELSKRNFMQCICICCYLHIVCF